MTKTASDIVMCDNCICKKFTRMEIRMNDFHKKGGYCSVGRNDVYNTLEYCDDYKHKGVKE